MERTGFAWHDALVFRAHMLTQEDNVSIVRAREWILQNDMLAATLFILTMDLSKENIEIVVGQGQRLKNRGSAW